MKEVIVYTSNNCGACDTLITVLKSNGITPKEKNVSTDEQAYKEVTDLGFMGTPVAIAEGVEPFSGIDPKGIQQLIEKYGK